MYVTTFYSFKGGVGRTMALINAAVALALRGRRVLAVDRGLHRVREDLGKDRTACHGVYLGQRAALWDDIRVLPLVDFLKRLWAGEIIGAARLSS